MRVLFPGSFDPITKGHLDIIKRASALFDEVLVAIMTNSTKNALFNEKERLNLIQQEIVDLENVKVITVEKKLTVDVAIENNVNAIIRGVRDVNDFEFEKNLAIMNHKLSPKIETLLLPSTPDLSAVSSSLIKEIADFGGDISAFVSKNVLMAIEEKLNEKEK